MGLPFNSFSVFDLLSSMVTGGLAVIFCLIFLKFGRNRLDLLLASLMACASSACFAMFMQDNVVPEGQDATAICSGAQASRFWFRAMYIAGLPSMPIMLHFVLRYCRSRSWLARRIYVLYAASFLGVPLVLSDSFFGLRLEPLAKTSDWLHMVPWMPAFGPWVGVYAFVWISVYVFALGLLYRRGLPMASGVSGALRHVRLLILAFVGGTVGTTVDLAMGWAGHCGVCTYPFVAMFMSVVLSLALIRERLAADRHHREAEREMQLASRVQRNLLPMGPPEVAGFELTGWSRFANLTGGDTYDFFPLNDRQLVLALGDASGHGMGPALLIAETHSLLRATAQTCNSPSETLRRVDRLLSPNLEAGQFVTCFVGILDVPSADLTYASAGQGPIFFYEHAVGTVHEEVATVLPLGVASAAKEMPTGAFRTDRQRKLARGDFLTLISDGCYEAAGPSGELFGAKRVRECLLRCRGEPAHQVLTALCRDIDAFVGSSTQEDDMTIVILRKQ